MPVLGQQQYHAYAATLPTRGLPGTAGHSSPSVSCQGQHADSSSRTLQHGVTTAAAYYQQRQYDGQQQMAAGRHQAGGAMTSMATLQRKVEDQSSNVARQPRGIRQVNLQEQGAQDNQHPTAYDGNSPAMSMNYNCAAQLQPYLDIQSQQPVGPGSTIMAYEYNQGMDKNMANWYKPGDDQGQHGGGAYQDASGFQGQPQCQLPGDIQHCLPSSSPPPTPLPPPPPPNLDQYSSPEVPATGPDDISEVNGRDHQQLHQQLSTFGNPTLRKNQYWV